MPEEGKEIFRRRLTARFSYLDKHLSEHDYLMGKDFSVADAHLFVISKLGEPGGFRFGTLSNCSFVP